jgi:hypothetical protein
MNILDSYEDSSVVWMDVVNGETVIYLEVLGNDISKDIEEIASYFKQVEVSYVSDIINPKDGTWASAMAITVKEA